MSIEVSQLNIYPIKSCAAISVEDWAMTKTGLAYDREWMLIGSNGQPITQRTDPKLAQVTCQFETYALGVSLPSEAKLEVPLSVTPDMPSVEVELFKKPGSGFDHGKEAADFFSDYLQKQYA